MPKSNCLILILPPVNLFGLFFNCLHKTTQQRVTELSNTSSTNSICLPHMLWYHSKLNNQCFIWNDNTKLQIKEIDFFSCLFHMSHTIASRLHEKLSEYCSRSRVSAAPPNRQPSFLSSVACSLKVHNRCLRNTFMIIKHHQDISLLLCEAYLKPHLQDGNWK